MQNYARVGGVLSIVSGAIGAFIMLFLVGFGIFVALVPNIFGADFYNSGMPENFMAVGCYYAEFPQIADSEVVTLLENFKDRLAALSAG